MASLVPDLSVDSQSATSSSPEDSSPVNSVGSSEASKDSDEWLPDLDSSSGDSDLESCESIYANRLHVIAILHCIVPVFCAADTQTCLLSVLYVDHTWSNLYYIDLSPSFLI